MRADSGTVLTAQEGDTLSALAQRLYGDASLWYVLAEANGLPDRNAALPAGTLINAPAVVRNSNTFATFSPYDPGARIGQMSPAQVTPPPPPSKGGCGALGTLIMVVVAVVVTAVTYGAMGGSALAGLQAIGAGAVSAAAGSAASQMVGLAIGAQDKFSWKQVGLAAIGGAVSAGITGALGEAAKVVDLQTGLQAAGRAMLTNAITQGLSVATGLQDSFSWKAVAVSGLVAPISQYAGAEAGEWAGTEGIGNWGQEMARSVASGLSGGLIRAATYNKGKIDWSAIAADSFGNAIGNSVVAGMKPETLTVVQGRPFTWEDNPNAISEDTRWNAEGSAANNNGVKPIEFDPQARIAAMIEAAQGGALQVAEPGRRFTIRQGDTLERLAGTSDPATLDRIAEYNGLRSRHEIVAGRSLTIPDEQTLAGVVPGQALAERGAAMAQMYAQRQAAEAQESTALQRRGADIATLRALDNQHLASPFSAAMQSDPRLMQGTVGYSAAELAEYRRTSGGFEPVGGFPSPVEYTEAKTAMRMQELAAQGKFDPTWAAAAAASISFARTDSPYGGAVANPSTRASIDAEVRAARNLSGLRESNAMGSVANARFAQDRIRADEAFSAEGQALYSQLAGKPIRTVDDLAAAIRSGAVSTSQVPVSYVEMNGVQLILNTRTSVALDRAGVPQSSWYGTNQTNAMVPGMPGTTFNDLAARQLRNNRLPPTGTSNIPGRGG